MQDKRNATTLYKRPPGKSNSLSLPRSGNRSLTPTRSLDVCGPQCDSEETDVGSDKKWKPPPDINDIHAQVLRCRKFGMRNRMHSLEDEMREIDLTENELDSISVLSVETASDSMLVKLLNYLKDRKVSVLKIRKEQLEEIAEASSRKSSLREESPEKTNEEIANEEQTKEEKSQASKESAPQSEEVEKQLKKKCSLRRQLSRYDVFVNLQEDGKRLNELLMQIENQVGGVRYRRGNQLMKQHHLSSRRKLTTLVNMFLLANVL